MADRELYFPKLVRRSKYSSQRHYRKYKSEIRVDCQGRCVYCDAHENELGGAEHMTLDHFRPRKHFSDLEHEPTNLVWSCRICNIGKDSAWPALGTTGTVVSSGGFLDPFSVDLHEYFDVDSDGQLIPLKHPARYMIRVMKLNRDGASRIRRKRKVDCDVRQATLATLMTAIRQIDDALDYDGLPSDLISALLTQKEALSRQYDAIQTEDKPDFRLY